MKLQVSRYKENLIQIKFFCEDKKTWFFILEQVKTLSGRQFHSDSKMWTAYYTKSNLETLYKLGFETEYLMKYLEKEKWIKPWKNESLDNTPDFLRPYQVEGLKFLKYKKGRGLIGWEIGTGKTIIALGFIKAFNIKSAIIIVPASVKLQWKKQFKRFLGSEPTILYGRTPSRINVNGFYIINWDIIHDWEKELLENDPELIIADESTAISNIKSLRSKTCIKLAKQTKYFIPMSGTPIRTRPAQFFNVLNLLEPEMFKNHWSFLQRYCNPKHNGFGWTFNGATNIEELHDIIKNLMSRIKKKEVLQDLPDKLEPIIVPFEIDKTDDYLEYYNNFIEKKGLGEKEAFSNLKIESFFMKSLQVVDWIKEWINDTDQKILIFTYHRKVIKFLHEQFKDDSVYFDGSITGNKRELVLDKFIQDENTRILFAQIQSGGIGIDGLQNVCNNCCFVEFANTPIDHVQAEGRLWRSGQNKEVNVYYLIADNTIENDIMYILDRRREVFDALIDGRVTENVEFLSYLKKKYKGELVGNT